MSDEFKMGRAISKIFEHFNLNEQNQRRIMAQIDDLIAIDAKLSTDVTGIATKVGALSDDSGKILAELKRLQALPPSQIDLTDVIGQATALDTQLTGVDTALGTIDTALQAAEPVPPVVPPAPAV